jgi:uncharacterized protein YqgC (DUF456 family)
MSEGATVVLVTLIGLVIAVGVVGTLVPILPGPLMIWGAALTYGLITGFGAVGWIMMALITGGLFTALYFGVRIPQKSAAGGGLGTGTQLFALALAVVGFFVIPVLGAALGFTLGIWLATYRQEGDVARANRSTLITLRAFGKATLLQFACAVAMAGSWALWVLIG